MATVGALELVEAKVVIRASSASDKSLCRENASRDTQSRLQSTADEANKTTRDAIDRLQLSNSEKQRMSEIYDFDSFVRFVDNVQRDSAAAKQNSVGAAVQQSAAQFKSFADAYSELFHAITDAVPFGAGKLAYGFCGVLLSVISTKVDREEAMRKSLGRVTKTLPRLKQYGDVYRKSTRITEALMQLHTKVIEFLCEVFLYCKDRGVRGSILRYKKAVMPSDKIASLVDEINVISRDIYHEGMVELSSEVRNITQSMKTAELNQNKALKDLKETKAELEKANKTILELNQKVTEATDLSLGNDIERIKSYFVDHNYDPATLFEHAKSQILQSSTTESQKENYRRTLDCRPLSTWLDPSNAGMSSLDTAPVIWLTSETPDSSISHMSLMVLDCLLAQDGRLCDFSTKSRKVDDCLIIYSPYQEGIATSTLHNGIRTAYTLFQEAIYQLILHRRHLIRENKQLQELCYKAQSNSLRQLPGNETDIDQMAKLLRDLVQLVLAKARAASTDSTEMDGLPKETAPSKYPTVTVTPVPPSTPSIYWIIDRIDTVQWLRSGTPRKSKSRGPNSPMAFEFSKFARAVETVVRGQKGGRRRRNKKRSHTPDGVNSFKVLITSAYSPTRLDDKWTEDISDEDDSDSSIDRDECAGLKPGWTELTIE